MRSAQRLFLAILTVAFGVVSLRAQDDEVAQRQKKRGLENWKKAFDSQPGLVHESQNFIFLAPGGFEEARIRVLAERMDAQFNAARRALGGGEAKKALWPGKMTVYLLGEKRNMNSLIRTVEKRRPADVGLGSFYLKGEQIHIAACNPASKEDLPLEQQAIRQLMEATLTRFAGDGNGIADWMVEGFLDATAWEADPKQRSAEVKAVLALVNHKKTPKEAKDLWAGTLTGRDQYLVRTSLVDFLAFGPPQAKFPELVRAFKPERRGQVKPLDSVLTSIDQNTAKLNRHWKTWVRAGSKTDMKPKE